MLVESGLVEPPRYRAVLQVLVEGVRVSEVATRFGVSRQSMHAAARIRLPASSRQAQPARVCPPWRAHPPAPSPPPVHRLTGRGDCKTCASWTGTSAPV
jgi:hypothetical protein